jgi:hypothetical protein
MESMIHRKRRKDTSLGAIDPIGHDPRRQGTGGSENSFKDDTIAFKAFYVMGRNINRVSIKVYSL